MNKTLKGIILIIVLFLVFVAGYNLRARGKHDNASDKQNEIYLRYMEKQDKSNTEYMEKLNINLLQAEEINNRVNENQKRYEKILDRWEKQADRMDIILSIQESNKN